MSWLQRIALGLSLSCFFVFSISLTINWVQGPGLENLAGEIKSSDLFQHYGAGTFVREGTPDNLYQGGNLGLWISQQHGGDKVLTASGFNYVYPPLVAWICAPFSNLSYLTFAFFWLGFSLFFYFVSAILLLNGTGTREVPFWLLLLLGLPSLHYTFILGQNSCLTFFIICSSAYLLSKKRDLLAGLVLSCLFYKPQFLPLLLGFMLITGQVRFVASAALGSVFWLAIGLLFCGWQSYSNWLSVLQKLNSGEQVQFVYLNQTLKMFILNFLGQSARPGSWTGPLTTFLGLSLLGVAALTVRYGRLNRLWSPSHSLLLAAAVMTVGSPYLMHYDLLLAAGWWWLCLQENENRGMRPWIYAALFWLISLFSVNTGDWAAPATAPLMLIYLALTMRMYFSSGDKSQNLEPGQR